MVLDLGLLGEASELSGLALELRSPDGALRRVPVGELGSLRLKPGRYELRLQAPGFVSTPFQLVSLAPGGEVSLRSPALEPACVLRGRFEGPPHLRLRQVELELRAEEYDWRGVVTCTAEGAFERGDLPAGRYRIRARAEAEGEVYLSSWREARAAKSAGSGPRLRLVLARPFLEGRVRDHLGAPLGGVTLRVSREEALSDAEGRYRLYGLSSGEAWLEAEAEGFLRLRRSVLLGPGLKHDLELRPVCVVEGQLLDSAGQPLAGARVVLFQLHGPEQRTSQSVLSDSSGRFRFEPLLPGSYALGDDPALDPLGPTFELGPGESRAFSLSAR